MSAVLSRRPWGRNECVARFNSDAFGYIQKMQSRETNRAHEIKSPLNE